MSYWSILLELERGVSLMLVKKIYPNVKVTILLCAMLLLATYCWFEPTEVEGKEGDFGGGSGTASDPYIIEDVWDLQNMSKDLNAHYVLNNDIDAATTRTWNSGAGFVPIGGFSNNFTGSLEGRGYNISGLFIYRWYMDHVGLFGTIGPKATVKNVNILDQNITGGDHVGGLVGTNYGTVTNGYSDGTTSGYGHIGGLIGNNQGIVRDCCAAGTPNGGYRIGGRVGSN